MMKRIMSGSLLGVALLAASLLAGCAHKPAAAEAKPLSQAELDSMIRKKAAEDPVLRSQTDFGLDARQSAPNRVLASVKNKTQKAVVVGPKCFGVILPGTRKLLSADGQSVKLFPVARLKPDEEASGELVFAVDALVPGTRLVFDAHDGSQAAMTKIR
jgi:hypothetical protein